MRILLSIHQTLDRRTGTGLVTCELADALRRRGHTVDVMSFERVSAPERVKTYLYPWFVAAFAARSPRYDVLDLSARDGWVLSLLRNTWPRAQPAAIVARSHGLEHLLHEARLRASEAGALKLRWTYPLYKGGVRLWECRASLTLAGAALFLNETELRYAVDRLGVDPARAVRVRNGIADRFVRNATSLLAASPRAGAALNVAFVGRYSDLKGARETRAAMGSVLSAHPAVRFGLFGTMAGRDRVLADYPPDVRDRIRVVPDYENSELPTLLDGYHVLAFPSLFEGFALVPLEAMACGVVPVAAATPGPMSYIEDGRNGILVPPGDAGALERAIDGLLRDVPRWETLRRRGLATAAAHSWDAVASDLETVYARVVARDHKRTTRARH